MGTLSSSTGLISGFDTANIVKQLMEIEARPLNLLKSRVEETNKQKLAYQTLNGLLLSALGSVGRLAESSAFTARTATSSNPEVLGASADATAAAGSYSFLVRSIVSTHQLASGGFADRNATPVGAGTLTFEPAQARVDPDTELGTLNGGAGVRRGQIRVTDRTGAAATIDLRSAYTVNDVLEAINSQTQVGVRAYVSQDRIVIEDVTGVLAGTGQLTIANVGAGQTATDLGIVGTDAGTGRITSNDLVRLTASTNLAALNDGLGVRFNRSDADLRVTLANGRVFDIGFNNSFNLNTSLAELNGGQGVGAGSIRITNSQGVSRVLTLTGNETINDIKATLASDAYKDLNVTFSSVSGSGSIILSDNSGGSGNFKVEDVTGTIAGQLKLAADTSEDNITGRANYQLTTLNSLIRKIQFARDSTGTVNGGAFDLSISADGKGVVLTDRTTGGATASVVELNGSKALQDLGLTGTFQGGVLTSQRLASSLNTVLLKNLNGGAGVRLGPARFTLRDGSERTIDFAGSQTLQDVIDRINATGVMKAEISAGGTGLTLSDLTTGSGAFGATRGDTLTDLHLPMTSTNGVLVGGDVNRKYVSESTLLSTLNGGKGIGLNPAETSSTARFQITNSAGESVVISLAGSVHKTMGDVISAINEAMATKGVQARVNANGDGLELVEASPTGTGVLTVAEVSGGTTAAALGLKGQASADQPGVLTGSLAGTVEIGAADTLDDVMNKINAAGLNARASIIHDGSGSRPYRLVVTSNVSGTAGQLAFGTGQTGLSFQTLTEAEDARVVIGNLDSPSSIVVSSSTNKVTGIVQGLTLDLLAPSSTPIQVNVAQNVDSIVNDLKSFVTAYNSIFDRIDELTKFDPETSARGVLLGDSTVVQIRDRLYRQVSRTLSNEYTLRRLTSAGISFGSGGRLELNETALKDAVASDPEGVKALFTKVVTVTDADGKETVQYVGIAARLKQELRNMTNTSTGLLGLQATRLDERVELYSRRMEDMQELLDRKEARYYAQFQAMEKALAEMQQQQTSLTSLSNMVGSFSSTAGA